MTHFVFSTLSADVCYDTYQKGAGDLPIKSSSITIKGGTGIASPRLITNHGAIATKVSDEQLALLKANPVFKMHSEHGFVTILKNNDNGEVVAANMQSRDISAPLVDNDFSADNKAKIKTKKTG